MKWLRRYLRKWLGIDELETRVHRAELVADGYDPGDPYLIFKLQMKAMESCPGNIVLTNVKVPGGF